MSGPTLCEHGRVLRAEGCECCAERSRGRADERREIVAWLRDMAEKFHEESRPWTLGITATAIERGDHVKGK